LDPDAPHIRALELFCVRASLSVLTLSVRGIDGIGEAIARQRPSLVVVAGSHVEDDAVARWAYAIRLAIGRFPLTFYRRGETHVTRNLILPHGALAAQGRVLELIKAHQARQAPVRSSDVRGTGAPAAMARAAGL
jgi:hypothetical protein